MKKSINKIILAIVAIAIILVFPSCNNDDDIIKSKTAIQVEGIYQTTKSAQGYNSLSDDVVIESFKINIEEIEIEFDDDDPLFKTDTIATDYELEGPFEIDLVKNKEPLTTTIVDNVDLPAAAYEEIEFKFRESENSISDMYGKSILIKGTIYDKPFVFWTDEEIEIEIEFDELVYLDEASRSILTISFDLGSLFDYTAGGVDIRNAKDENNNGIIEIYPDDPDGNSDLADMIWEKIEDIIEAFEDKYDN